MAQQTRAPTSNIGTGGTVAYSSGTSAFALVNDYPDTADPLTSYVTLGTTASSFFTCGFSNFTVPAGSTINWVEVQYYDEEPSTGTNASAGRIRVNATYYDSATHNPSTTTTQRLKRWTTNPAGGSWTVDQVNNVGGTGLNAFGVIGPDSNPIHRVGAMQIVVDYTPPTTTIAGDKNTDTTVSGKAATFQTSVTASKATIALTGKSAIPDKSIPSNKLGVNVTGKNATFQTSVAAGKATLALTGKDATAGVTTPTPKLYYVIYPAAESDPSAAQIKAGQKSNGSAAVAAGNEDAPATSQTYTFASPATGLTASTNYKIAFVWSDSVDDSNVAVGSFATASANVTVDGDKATINVTGKAATFQTSLKADKATVAMTGKLAGVDYAWRLPATKATLGIAGKSASFIVSVPGSKATLGASPKAATLQTATLASKLAVAFTGKLAGIDYQWRMVASKASIGVTGKAATLQTSLAAAKATVAETGKAATLQTSLVAGKTTVTLTGKDAEFQITTVGGVIGDKGSLAIAGKPASFSTSLAAGKASLTVAGKAVVLATAYRADKAATAVSGRPAGTDVSVPGTKATITLTGKNAVFGTTSTTVIDGGKATVAITGKAARFATSFAGAKATVLFTGQMAAFQTASTTEVIGAKGALTFTGKLATFTTELAGFKAQLGISGLPAATDVSLKADKGTIELTGGVGTVVGGGAITGDLGSIALTGKDATFTVVVKADKGTITIVGGTTAPSTEERPRGGSPYFHEPPELRKKRERKRIEPAVLDDTDEIMALVAAICTSGLLEMRE